MLAILKQQQLVETKNRFAQDACDFFSGRRSGHMGLWRYSESLYANDPVDGARYWAQAVNAAKEGNAYYVFKDEQECIEKGVTIAQKYIQRNCTLIDLGPGSADAFCTKVRPWIDCLQPHIREYVGVDICSSSLESVTHECQNAYPHIFTQAMKQDFFEDSFRYPSTQPCELAVLFGLTMFNLCIDPLVTELPELMLESYLKRLKKHFKTECGFLAVTQDINREELSLYAAYDTLSQFSLNLLWRIKRDLPVTGDYDPNYFDFAPHFVEETGALIHSFICNRSFNFSIGEERFAMTKGQRLFLHNTYKFSAEKFVAAADKAHFVLLDTIYSPSERIALHILAA